MKTPNQKQLELMQDDYEERAAIIEFDGGLVRSESEIVAAKTVVYQLNQLVEVEKLTEVDIQQIVKIFHKLKKWKDEDAQKGKSRTNFKVA